MDFSLLTLAAQEIKSAISAIQAGKKFTALKHGGQAAVHVGDFGAAWQGEDQSSITMSFAALEMQYETASAGDVLERLESELSAPRATDADAKLGPIALFLIQLALRKLLERILK